MKAAHRINGMAIVLVFALLAVGAFAVYTAVRTPTVALVAQTPREAALAALSDVARADAQSIIERQLAVIDELAARATKEPGQLYAPAWRNAWQGAWAAIWQNSTGEMRAAAATCLVDTYAPRTIDIPECVRVALRATAWSVRP